MDGRKSTIFKGLEGIGSTRQIVQIGRSVTIALRLMKDHGNTAKLNSDYGFPKSVTSLVGFVRSLKLTKINHPPNEGDVLQGITASVREPTMSVALQDLPESGQLVNIRSRSWVVGEVQFGTISPPSLNLIF